MTMGPMSYGDWLRENKHAEGPEASAAYAAYSRRWYEAKHNKAAVFHPFGLEPDGETRRLPAIEIGGALVFAYVQNGSLVVSVHLDDAHPGVFALYGEDKCVPVQVTIGDTTIYREPRR